MKQNKKKIWTNEVKITEESYPKYKEYYREYAAAENGIMETKHPFLVEIGALAIGILLIILMGGSISLLLLLPQIF